MYVLGHWSKESLNVPNQHLKKEVKWWVVGFLIVFKLAKLQFQSLYSSLASSPQKKCPWMGWCYLSSINYTSQLSQSEAKRLWQPAERTLSNPIKILQHSTAGCLNKKFDRIAQFIIFWGLVLYYWWFNISDKCTRKTYGIFQLVELSLCKAKIMLMW